MGQTEFIFLANKWDSGLEHQGKGKGGSHKTRRVTDDKPKCPRCFPYKKPELIGQKDYLR